MKSKISNYIKNLQNNKLATINFLVLLFSIFWLKEINYLFYDINDSPDFTNTLFTLIIFLVTKLQIKNMA